MRPPRGQPHNNVYSLVYYMYIYDGFCGASCICTIQLGLSVVLHSPGGHMLHSW